MTTEAEVAPVVDAVPAPEGEAKPAEGKKAEKSAPVKDVPKPDKPRMPKPDRTQLEGTIAVLQEAADNNQARIEELMMQQAKDQDALVSVQAELRSTHGSVRTVVEENEDLRREVKDATGKLLDYATRSDGGASGGGASGSPPRRGPAR